MLYFTSVFGAVVYQSTVASKPIDDTTQDKRLTKY